MASPESYGVAGAGISPDGQKVLAYCDDGELRTIRIWHAGQATEITTLRGHTGGLRSAVFSPDGRYIVSAAADKTARLWDAGPRNVYDPLQRSWHNLASAALSADGRRLVVSPYPFWNAHQAVAEVWDVGSDQPRTMLRGHTLDIRLISTDAAGDKVMTFGQEGTVRIWETATGKELARLKGFDIPQDRVAPDNRAWAQGIRLSPDGRYAITDQGSPLSNVHVWDAATGEELPQLFREKDGDVIRQIVFSPDGNLAFTSYQTKGEGGQMLAASLQGAVWNAQTGQLMASLPAFFAHNICWNYEKPAFSRDGRWLFTTSANEGRIWDAPTGKEVAQFYGHGSGILQADFSPNGTRVVTALGDGTARVWEVATGRQLQVLKGHEGVVRSAAYSPDGRRIVTGGEDRTARLYDAESGKEIATFRGHIHNVKEVRFAGDGRWVFTRGDLEVRLWAVDFLAEARQRKPRELTATERERFEVGGVQP